MPKLVDLTGKRFGRWLVIERTGANIHGSITWKVRCDCGVEKVVNGTALRQGASNSCGCLNIDVHREVCIKRNTTHGLSDTKIHNVWDNMKARCQTPTSTSYQRYGGKGIKVCERWQSFENFYADMGDLPSPKHTLDRIDPRGHYEPCNCRWATQKEQQNNRTNNRLITHNGTTKTLQQWAEYTGVTYKAVSWRLKHWPIEKALATRI